MKYQEGATASSRNHVSAHDRLMDDYCLFLMGNSYGVKTRHDGGGRAFEPREAELYLSLERRFGAVVARVVPRGMTVRRDDILPHGLWMAVYVKAAEAGLPVPAFVRRTARQRQADARRFFCVTL